MRCDLVGCDEIVEECLDGTEVEHADEAAEALEDSAVELIEALVGPVDHRSQ